MQLVRDGRQDFVKEIANKNYYSGSKQLSQELDLELYIHIEKVGSKSYLTIQRGKHRGTGIIPDAQKYMVLPFYDVGGLRDDILGEDSTLRKPGGTVSNTSGETDFFDFNSQI